MTQRRRTILLLLSLFRTPLFSSSSSTILSELSSQVQDVLLADYAVDGQDGSTILASPRVKLPRFTRGIARLRVDKNGRTRLLFVVALSASGLKDDVECQRMTEG